MARPAYSTILFALAMSATPLAAAPPRPAPPLFASELYGLTFASPPGTTYCPLPAGQRGAEHGTMLFLAPPADCGGGSSSAERDFMPADVPRIEIRYWAEGDDYIPPSRWPCLAAPSVHMLDGERAYCALHRGGMILTEVRADYRGRIAGTVSLTLVTNAARADRDEETFLALARALRTCRLPYADGQGDRFFIEVGPLCPTGSRFF